jgi:hypothetical protein
VQKANHRKMLDDNEARTIKALDDGMQSLGAVLGIKPEDLTAATLQSAIVALRHRIQGNGLDRAIELLQGLRGTLPANDKSVSDRGWQ